MRRQMRKTAMLLAGVLWLAPLGLRADTASTKPPAPLEERVRKELVMLPWYGVFDNLAFQVEGDQVTLSGQVARPTLKSDAENVVKRLAGVRTVVNQIDVLPLSPFDNRIRWAAVRAIYGFPSLNRYALGAHPSIHIIVKNGEVTLEGVVDREADRNLAGLLANGVFGAFSVTNNLRVVRS